MKHKIETDIQFLKGIGTNRAESLHKMGIYTIADLVEYFPRTYIDRQSEEYIADLPMDGYAAISGKVVKIEEKRHRQKGQQLNLHLSDGDDIFICTWFRYGAWLTAAIKEGAVVWVSGKVTGFKKMKQMIHPEIEILNSAGEDDFWKTRRRLPVYTVSDKLTVKVLRKLTLRAFEALELAIREILPENICAKYKFQNRYKALYSMHFPEPETNIETIRKRFVYEELFFHQLMLARVKHARTENRHGIAMKLHKTFTTTLKLALPFELTSAQKRA
ncbi:MAG: hypothetical protein K8S56_09730, partial [Candidatus Cloacimonetes bacterium]|nr:hypothetical protein [Candidatus Cloacimonadota bacterium]